VILTFGFHLVVGGLAVGGLMLVGAVPRVYKDYAGLHERDANKGPTA
jgi:hypothetical protein